MPLAILIMDLYSLGNRHIYILYLVHFLYIKIIFFTYLPISVTLFVWFIYVWNVPRWVGECSWLHLCDLTLVWLGKRVCVIKENIVNLLKS